MVEQCDVLIVGAGTAGTYLGWRIAKRGRSVTILEKDERENVGKRLDVIHFETDRVKLAGIPPFKVGNPDCLEIREESTVVSPDFKTKIKTRALQTIVRLTPFLQRFYKTVEADGVNLEFSCLFSELIYENGKIVGVLAEKQGEKIEYRARLVVDASGTRAVMRTSLPSEYGVETFELGPNDVMYVLLQYIKWSKPEEPHPEVDTSYIYYLAWLGPSHVKNGVILGIGQMGSYENARKVREDLLKKANLPPYEIIKKEQGITPWRRPPYSLVGDAFFCVGDAAAITYPFSGHGTTATWVLCMIAAEVIDESLQKDGYLSKEQLWDINVKYFKDQGAKFAGLLAQLSGILHFTEKEWNYLIKKEIIYKSGDKEEIPEPNKEYEQEMSASDILKFIGSLLAGLIKRKLSLKNVRKLLKANGLAGKVRKHYENYPDTPANFESWVIKAQELWEQKKVVAKRYPSIIVEYH